MMNEAGKTLKATQNEYREIKEWQRWTQKNLKERAQFYANCKTTKGIKSEIERILEVERQRQSSCRINFALHRNMKIGANGIIIHDKTEY